MGGGCLEGGSSGKPRSARHFLFEAKIVGNIINCERIITNLGAVYSKKVVRPIRKDMPDVFYKIGEPFRYDGSLGELAVLADFHGKLPGFDPLDEISGILGHAVHSRCVLPLRVKAKTLQGDRKTGFQRVIVQSGIIRKSFFNDCSKG